MTFDLYDAISSFSLLGILILIYLLTKRSTVRSRKKNTYIHIIDTIDNRYSIVTLTNDIADLEMEVWDAALEDTELDDKLKNCLNYCEYLAIGIDYKLLDEKMVKSLFGDTLIHFYHRVERYINRRRLETNTPDAFKHFNQLILRWDNRYHRSK